jgi:hypothetical protein
MLLSGWETSYQKHANSYQLAAGSCMISALANLLPSWPSHLAHDLRATVEDVRHRRERERGDRPPRGLPFPALSQLRSQQGTSLVLKSLTAALRLSIGLSSRLRRIWSPTSWQARPHLSSLLNTAIPSKSQAEDCDQQALLDVGPTQFFAIGLPMSCQDASYPVVSDSGYGANNSKLRDGLSIRGPSSPR